MKIAISSGHGKYVRGASGFVDEVDEARRVVDRLGELMPDSVTFHDNTSTSQDQNLKTIVNWHNAQFDGEAELHVSVHFNAYKETQGAMGTETCWVSQEDLAIRISKTISSVSGIVLHGDGSVYRPDLYFLNKTNGPAVLLEICFVDSAADVEAYQNHFDEICAAIADMVPQDAVAEKGLHLFGKCSFFGGPDDMGVTMSEGLAMEAEGGNPENRPELFLSQKPPGVTGIARQLDPDTLYLACRWDYEQFSKEHLVNSGDVALVSSLKTGKKTIAHPIDWGPAAETGRVVDVSPGVFQALGDIETDDEVDIVYPYHEPKKRRT